MTKGKPTPPKWIVVRLGGDMNWWLDEASADIYWGEAAAGCSTRAKSPTWRKCSMSMSPTAFSRRLLDAAFQLFELESELDDDRLRLAPVDQDDFAAGEQLFALPLIDDDETGAYYDFLDAISAARIRKLNATHDYARDCTELGDAGGTRRARPRSLHRRRKHSLLRRDQRDPPMEPRRMGRTRVLALFLASLGSTAFGRRLVHAGAYQRTISRAEFDNLVANVYCPSGALTNYLTFTTNSVTRVLHDREDESTTVHALRFSSSASSSNVHPSPSFKRIALDPGHIGGEWARMEERFFERGKDRPVQEAVLNLMVARLLKTRLEAMGRAGVPHQRQF
jgi:N-acetylmuramoyl-L-alanine amidase